MNQLLLRIHPFEIYFHQVLSFEENPSN
uniref:Uncharacterized protein n=1 Tax=Arundo donax TaxID=35708 RepID=A0A0A9BWX1_ARUDO